MNQNLGQPVKNKHKVPVKQWNKWSNHARRVFNEMYYSLRPSMQLQFLHPDALPASKEHWGTTRWNVAWTAAEAVKGFSLGTVISPTRHTWVKRSTKAKKKAVRRGK